MSACRYLLTRVPGDKADLAVELYVRDNLIIRLMFRMLMEKKLKASFERSMANLAALCEKDTAIGQTIVARAYRFTVGPHVGAHCSESSSAHQNFRSG